MKEAFWIVAGAGILTCSVAGIGAGLARSGGSWTDPFIIAGCVLGVIALGLVVSFAFGFKPPVLSNDTAYLLAISALVAAKFALSTLHRVAAAR